MIKSRRNNSRKKKKEQENFSKAGLLKIFAVIEMQKALSRLKMEQRFILIGAKMSAN